MARWLTVFDVRIPIRRHIGARWLLCFAAVTASCGKADPKLPATVPVTGKILFKGQPLKDASITFHPKGAGNPAIGRSDANGQFTLTTYKQNDGAIVGPHAVTVQVFPEGGLPGAEVASTGGTAIPAKYASLQDTPLTAEVATPGPNQLELKLEN